jgi:Uma2 family endonuclease
MPKGTAHLVIRIFVYQLLRHMLGHEHSVGSDQFVYWASNDPRRCLSPDVFVKLAVPQTAFGTWKCWKHGAPELAVEVVSPNEGDGIEWDEKLARYDELGVEELLRFDPEGVPGERLRAWDRVEGDFVERLVEGDRTPCLSLARLALAVLWVVTPVEELPVGLRLVDGDGKLVPTREENEREARRAEAEGRRAEAEGRKAAEARVRELEEELRRRS